MRHARSFDRALPLIARRYLHGTFALGVLIMLAILLGGCAAAGEGTRSSRDHDAYSGDLHSYSYEIRIWWDGSECRRREIRMRRRCGTCHGEASRATLYDDDCDGEMETISRRLGDTGFDGSERDLEEEAWHAFFHLVPPSRSGHSRTLIQQGAGI